MIEDPELLAWLAGLARPFPDSFVGTRPQGTRQVSYVAHGDVTARLLHQLGPFDMLADHVVGDVWSVTLTVHPPNRDPVTVREVSTHAEAETAVSRALCRAAMRVGGVALNLWARHTVLYDQLQRDVDHELGDPEGLPMRDVHEDLHDEA